MNDNANTAATTITDTVIAENAPIGVLLWPVRHPRYARNFTLAEVRTHRTADRTWVTWIYENGNVRTFDLGDSVAVKIGA